MGDSTRAQLFERHGGGGGAGEKGYNRSAYNEATEGALEQENDALQNLLGDKVSQLKQVSLRIKGEVESQNDTLDNMDNMFDKTLGSLGGTMKNLGVMMGSGGSKHMCYLSGFIFGFFMFIYLLLR